MSFKEEYTAFLDTECVGELAEKMEGALKHGLTFARRTAPVGTYVKTSFIRPENGVRVSKSPKGYVPGAFRKSIKFAKDRPIGGSTRVHVSRKDPFHLYYIYTDSPYARCIEYGCKGKVPWSFKAPRGVFGITAISIKARLSR
jgi:hypothetical protein